MQPVQIIVTLKLQLNYTYHVNERQMYCHIGISVHMKMLQRVFIFS